MLTLDNLDNLQKQYHFIYPDLYRQMIADDFMNWGQINKDWRETVYPTLKDKPPFLLYRYGIEPIDFDTLVTYCKLLNQSLQDHLWSALSHHFLLVPFVLSESDCYCFIYPKDSIPDPSHNSYNLWQYLKLNQHDTAIAMIYHDDDVIMILAKNIQDFIFIQSLEIVTYICDEALINNGDIYQKLTNYLNSHSPYLNKKHYDVLKEVYQRPIITPAQSWTSKLLLQKPSPPYIIIYQEVDELKRTYANFEFLDREFG